MAMLAGGCLFCFTIKGVKMEMEAEPKAESSSALSVSG